MQAIFSSLRNFRSSLRSHSDDPKTLQTQLKSCQAILLGGTCEIQSQWQFLLLGNILSQKLCVTPIK